MTQKPNHLQGGILRPNVAIQQEYVNAVLTMVRRLGDEIKREVKRVFEESAHHGAMDDDKGGRSTSGNVSSQARIAISGLVEKYEPLFNRLAKKSTKRMIARTVKNSSVTLGMSLKDLSSRVSLNTDILNDRLQEIVTASTAEAVSLIKLIPQKYLGEVQGQVMRSITTGGGLQTLLPYLTEKYGQNIRHARNVAMDQTRKAYNNINAGRMQAIGVKEFEWIHTGGSQHPRQDHIDLNGKTFSLDDLPVIGVMYGREVHGKPGDLPFCRCVMRPIVSFGE